MTRSKQQRKSTIDSTEVKTEKVVDKNLILDDWDSQQSGGEKFDDDDKAETDEAKDVDEKIDIDATEKMQPSIESSENKNGNNDTPNDKKQAQKNELKTLINDWGDDDDEAF